LERGEVKEKQCMVYMIWKRLESMHWTHLMRRGLLKMAVD